MKANLETAERRPTRRLISTGVQVRRTRLGRGLFAGRHYRPDELIGEITGQVIADWNYSSRYCFDLGDIKCLEPDPPFRFANHSCAPNCDYRLHSIAEPNGIAEPDGASPAPRIFVLAIDAIRPGDELTIDYGWPAGWAIACRCGQPSCRGWIVAEDQLHLLGDR